MNGIIAGTRRFQSNLLLVLVVALLFLPAGCVERTVRINTEPRGATVFLNDQEVGQSPVRVPFTWYGDYDIIIRKKGYKTLQTNQKLKAPWYQLPFIDLVTECFIPFTIHDDREIGPFTLEPFVAPEKDGLLQRSNEMREMALTEGAE